MIVAKAIDAGFIQANVGATNNIPFFSFGYSVYENLDTDTGEYDSWNSYIGLCSLYEFSYNVSINSADEVYDFVALTMGNRTFNFSNGEYTNLDGTPFNISQIVSIVTLALGL